MKFNFFILLSFCVFFLACKQNTNQPTAETALTPTTAQENIPKIESEPIPVTPNTETPTLIQETPLTAYAQQFFTGAYWHYEAAIVIKAPEKGKAYIGKWIKLNVDNTLETGFYDGEITSGNWIVDESKNIITLVENGPVPVYNEWKIKTSSSSDAIMIWVGTKRFNQNNTQIKMIKYHEKPKKAQEN